MNDKNKDQSVPAANPYDLGQQFQFTYTIVVAMVKNCPTTKWRSWKDVPENMKKAVMDELLANSINRSKKKLLHQFGSQRFSKLEERHKGGSKFPEIDMFKEVYVQPVDKLREQFHVRPDCSEGGGFSASFETLIEEVFPLEDAGFQIMTATLDQTLGCRHGNVHRGLRKAHLRDLSASSSRQRTEEVQTLKFKVSQIVAQNNLMNQIRWALQIFGIHFPDIEPPPKTTSQPPAIVAMTSQPPPPDAATTPPTDDCDVDDYL
ncbi:hypothetical protein D8674_030708 [Pyrus ussuriensis x Pyrus communis]|uniref:Uncharacterized protein n=1 Tax=Pyrus ussuriensis x Pyrus communis TaxID=2448454 RepID=A0A5N5EWC1_9ROSA|nr:hypothetical protein D8674_030708 [Pyrus ussuriensis x Pyrus communis]